MQCTSEFTDPKSAFVTKEIQTAGLTVLLFEKSHLFSDLRLRHTLLEKPPVSCANLATPTEELRASGGTG